ncbi:MAG TPA: hypothetical protein VHU91_02550 [Mycobacteriales bacterium]|jgi:hypothetical protein|nr:hypothetical protein [Mycobacteriales bacterium]
MPETSTHPQFTLAQEIAGSVCHRHPAEIMAVGGHGRLTHDDERDNTDLQLVVITYRPQQSVRSTAREIDRTLVEVEVVTAENYLARARTLTVNWPLLADRYLYTVPLHDEVGWHRRLRDTHIARLAEAPGTEFTVLARESWCRASSYFRRAQWHSERFDADRALLLLAEARIATAVTEGLLTRTYFRSAADAAKRTALAGADLESVGTRIESHAEELAKRGRPVVGTVSDLFG